MDMSDAVSRRTSQDGASSFISLDAINARHIYHIAASCGDRVFDFLCALLLPLEIECSWNEAPALLYAIGNSGFVAAVSLLALNMGLPSGMV